VIPIQGLSGAMSTLKGLAESKVGGGVMVTAEKSSIRVDD